MTEEKENAVIAVIKKPGEKPEVKQIQLGLKELQRIQMS